jgi:hypothetical protein
MKRLLILILTICAVVTAMHAQRITRNFQNVSMSDALKYIQQQTGNHKIVFIYNELEDFTVTTHVKNKPVPDAIRQIIGFYPIQMILGDNNDIYVECIHKTEHHLKGLVVDENNLPLPYANVTLLNPADSTMVGGGVTNESGRFVIPNDHGKVIARITYVGYKTEHRLCARDNVGTIKMQPDNFALDGVTVKSFKRLTRPTSRGLLVNVQGTVLEQFGSVTEMLSHLPLMMSDGTIAGQHDKPEIYINNKKVRDDSELDRYRADEILSAEIITNPGPEYGQDVTSVIRLKTVKRQGEGWSGNFSTAYRQGKEYYANVNAALNYRTQRGMDFFARGYLTDSHFVKDATAEDQLQASSLWDYKKDASWHVRMKYYFADLGWNWEINDRHSVGVTYTAFSYIDNRLTRSEMDEKTWRDGVLVDSGHSRTNTVEKPPMRHTLNAYYVGQVGKWNIDFSADFYQAKSQLEMEGGTEGSTTVGSKTNSKNRLLAEKLVVTAPVPKGELTFGEEASTVHRTQDFTQSGFSADSHVKQQTSIWSLFANYSLNLGRFTINSGLRWQNEYKEYESDGVRDREAFPDYSVLIPRLSVTYKTEQWQHRLAYNFTRINPNYGFFSTLINYRSKYEYDTGNPLLKPQTNHNFSWSSSWKWIYAEVYYKYIKNTIRSFQTAYDDVNHPGVVIMDYRNTPKQEYYGITLNFSPKLGIWQMNYSTDLFFMNDDVYPLGITHKWNKLVALITLDNTFSLPHEWLLNMNGRIEPYRESGASKTEARGLLNLRLGKRFLKDKSLNVAILANDIFKTFTLERVAYGGINIRTHYREYQDYRRVGIDISWKFNATRSRYKGSHAGQDERNRL